MRPLAGVIPLLLWLKISRLNTPTAPLFPENDQQQAPLAERMMVKVKADEGYFHSPLFNKTSGGKATLLSLEAAETHQGYV